MSPRRPAGPADPDSPSPLSPLEEPAAMSAPTASFQPSPAAAPMSTLPPPAGPWRAERDPKESVRRVGLILALGFLAVSLAVAYYSANSILAIWFEYQYTPILRLVLALGVAALCVWVVVRLTQKR